MTKDKTLKMAFYILFIIYVLYLLYLLFLSQDYMRNIQYRSFNIIPFKTIYQYILTMDYSKKTVIINIIGNIAAFVPMGFFLPILFKNINSLLILAKSIIIIVSGIELLQYILAVGTADIDDLILNISGGILGFYGCIIFKKLN